MFRLISSRCGLLAFQSVNTGGSKLLNLTHTKTPPQVRSFASNRRLNDSGHPTVYREGLAFGFAAFMGFVPLLAACFGEGDEAGELEQKLLYSGTHDTALPKPGEIVMHDFRPNTPTNSPELPTNRPLRVVTWNIERGYELDAIIKQLQEVDADILAIQEIDIGCDRSDSADTGVAIAEKLGLNYVFLCEFTELRSQKRGVKAQGGGVHGNGIMTKYDIISAECIRHSHHPIPWESTNHVLCKQEPRLGERVTLTATIATPHGPVCTYSAHLEVFCGAISRLRQFADILNHSRATTASGIPAQFICGDLNTMGHGIARFSPFHCNDSLRWATLGQYESQFWLDTVFALSDDDDVVTDPVHTVRTNGASDSLPSRNLSDSSLVGRSRSGAHASASETLIGVHSESVIGGRSTRSRVDNNRVTRVRNERLWRAGIQDDELCRALVNPGFEEVFGVLEPTLDHPSFRVLGVSFMEGKLDWLLHKGGFKVVAKTMGNHEYSASDHKWLAADFEMVGDAAS